MNTFLCNRLESLYEGLKYTLFHSQLPPFSRKLVVVPSPAMKSWLMLKMADDPDLGIAMGIEITQIDHAIAALLYTHHPTLPLHFPSLTELTLAIEADIRQVISCYLSKTDREQTLWRPLILYLLGSEKIPPTPFSKKIDKRLSALAEILATLFDRYGKCGGTLLKEWEKNPMDNWQIALWNTLWDSRKNWTYPYALYGAPSPEKLTETPNLSLHIFGISFLSKLQHDCFKRYASFTSIHYYLLSPCQTFWSDILSDKESQWTKRYWRSQEISEQQEIALESFLRDRNPLLANFGRTGRVMATQLEEMQNETTTCYLLPETIKTEPIYEEFLTPETLYYPVKGPLTLLQAVQSDISLLRTPAKEQSPQFSPDDYSIAVHYTHSKWREADLVYDLILTLIDKHRTDSDPIAPSDILVMAPNIMDYIAPIQSIFDDETSYLDAQIMDMHIPSQSPLIQGFIHLLDLGESRWDTTTLLQLLEHPPFQKKQGLTGEEIAILRKWIKDAGIRWGMDSFHRDEILKREHCQQGMTEKTEIGTFEYGFHRLLNGMIYQYYDGEPIDEAIDCPPIHGIDLSHAPLLGKWITLIRSLHADLEPIVSQKLKTVAEWIAYFESLYSSYFASDKDETETLLINIFKTLKTAEPNAQQQFPYPSIRFHLDKLFNNQTMCHKETHLHAVRFCSMLPMRAIPAKVVILMGMEDGVFPRKESEFSLNLLVGQSKADYTPSQSDFDRYLFLEMLLSARKYFIITYSNSQAANGVNPAPSLVVDELLTYLKKGYQLEHTLHILHPFDPFDSAYFKSHCPLKTYSEDKYRQAFANSEKNKRPPHTFFSDFTHNPSASQTAEIPSTIDIKHLKQLAKDPIKHYMNHKLRLFLDKEEERIIKNEEEFSLTSLNKALIERSALQQPVFQTLKRAKKEGHLPYGCFGAFAEKKIKQGADTLRNNLIKAGANPIQFSTLISASAYTAHSQKNEKEWTLPSLSLTLANGQTVSLVGKIELVLAEGMVAHINDEPADVIKVWPEFLFFSALVKQFNLPYSPRLICSKSGVSKENQFEDPSSLLAHWIDYYLLGLKTPSPLIPEWIAHIRLGDPKKLEIEIDNCLNNPFKNFYNDYVKWSLSAGALPDTDPIVHQWKPIADNILLPIAQAWFPKLIKEN